LAVARRSEATAHHTSEKDSDKAPEPPPRTIVAIPARDEAGRLEACLGSLSRQVTLGGAPLEKKSFGVLLLLNNCRDASARMARRLNPRLPFPLVVKALTLPPGCAHAGAARGLAMDAAAAWVARRETDDAYLLTTDADTCVAPDWIARNHAAFAAGADVVAGLVIDDPVEHRQLPSRLRRRGRFEARYEALLTELAAVLDPDPDDPWPRHAMEAGASLGVRLSWYLKVGGVPVQPMGEDRALVRRLRAAGARVRHCLRTRVVTSCRLEGRAPGGMADTMRQRIAEPEAECDPMLEPLFAAASRYSWRGTLRHWYDEGRLDERCGWAADLGIPAADAAGIHGLANFEAIWDAVEAQSPLLQRRALRPAELPAEIELAKRTLRALRDRRARDAAYAAGYDPRLTPSQTHRDGSVDRRRWREAAEILA
jgi:hypothetical protein